MSPRLDHVSLVAERVTLEGLGFRVTPTPGAEDHARVFLDRTYLELTPPRDAVEVRARAWFLRRSDLGQAADSLRAAGFRVAGPSRYRGRDGEWLDVSASESEEAALPTLSKRLDRPEESWPPSLADPHPNGVTRLAALHLRARDPSRLLLLLASLDVPSPAPAALELAGGERLVVEPSSSGPEGISALVFERANDPEPLVLDTTP
jgi:hypothetical protein